MAAPSATPDPCTVALIGLGQMGRHMADHVAAAGHHLRAFDVSDAALARVSRAAVRASSPADAAAGADVVGIVVFDHHQVRVVLEGERGVLATVEPGAVIAVHSTVPVDAILEFARAADAAGARLIDAGISGGEMGARGGTLVTMVGGDDDAVRTARPVFESFSKMVVHAGPLGHGMALKLARNLVGYILGSATGEGIALAGAAGVDPRLLERVLRETTDANEAQLFGPFRRFDRPEPNGSADAGEGREQLAHGLALATKDLDDALALASRFGVELPMAMEAKRRYQALGDRHPPPS